MGPEWLNDILEWIRNHPGAAGLTIFVVAYLEGLALIGIIIPGIIILFGFGALVGLGVLELASVWFWCSLGAILGDASSFWLGHHFKDHLKEIWPFTRFATLFARGEAFFKRHGLKSVVIGRFIGPIRPVMPVIAGMMDMSVKRYVPANIIAGILWAPAYLLPGVVFGASIELAKAVAWRLGLLLCLVAGSMWLLSFLVIASSRYLAPRASQMLAFGLRWSHRHPILGRYTRPLVDPHRPDSGTLAMFAILVAVAGSGLVSLLITVPLTDLTTSVDQVVLETMQHLRTPWADRIMATLNGLGTVFVLLPSAAGVLVWLLWRRRQLAAWHWAGAVGGGLILAISLGYFLHWSRGDDAPQALGLLHVAMSVVVYGFFAILIARELPARRRMWPYLVAAALVGAIAIARLYFAAHGLTDLIAGVLLGVLWATIIGIAYRRRMRRSFWTAPLAGVFFLLVASCSAWYAYAYAGAFIDSRTPPRQFEALTSDLWWGKAWQPADGMLRQIDQLPLNFQFVGNPSELEAVLIQAGWQSPPTATWATAIEMLQPNPTPQSLPILPSAWQGRPETLLMHWPLADKGRQTVLHLWTTDILIDGKHPLWVGMVVEQHLESLLYFFSYWGFDGPTPADLVRLESSLGQLSVIRVDEDVLLIDAAVD